MVGLYFSAHWCPPCHRFTPELAKFYKEVKASRGAQSLEVCFVPYSHPTDPSKDTQEDHDDYYAQMPWCTLPFGEVRAVELKQKYGIKKIPTLVMVDQDGELISMTGKDDVEVGLNPMGSTDITMDGWNTKTEVKLPEKPTFSFSMDDDF